MKLVDILARELKVWPEGSLAATQDGNGEINHQTMSGSPEYCEGLDQWKAKPGRLCIFSNEKLILAEDYATAIVTRAEWQAAVDALNAPKVVEWDGAGNPPIGLTCEYRKTDAKYRQGFVAVTVLCYGKEKCFLQHEASKNEFTENLSSVEFRTIRTAEQVAAEEREKIAKELYTAVMDCQSHWPSLQEFRKEHYRSLVDAGWQKVAK